MKKTEESKYQLLLNYIENNNILKPHEFRKFYNLKNVDNTISSYINIMHNSFLIERIDVGIYKKTKYFYKISLTELLTIYNKIKHENNFKIKYFRKLKLNNIIN